MRLAALLLVVAALAGCGGGDDAADGEVPAVGSREWIEAPRQWPAELRSEFDLEPLNMELLHAPCGRDVDVGGYTDGAQEATVDVASAIHGILGRNWGSIWLDPCDDRRGKVGVPLRPRDELRKEIRRTREILAERNVDHLIDLVAVPVPSPALAAAQDRIHGAGVGDDTDLRSGQDAALNAIRIEVAADVDAAGWRKLRSVAAATGVNVVLERVDADDLRLKPL